jgi:hypothetical protein
VSTAAPDGTIALRETRNVWFTAEVDVPATATAEVALPGVSAGQLVWVDGTP